MWGGVYDHNHHQDAFLEHSTSSNGAENTYGRDCQLTLEPSVITLDLAFEC